MITQVIYSLTPLWSAIASWIFLGDEDGMGPLAYGGGAIVLAASILATTGGSADRKDIRKISSPSQ
jgi:drug/metabolite transporter (DMT)-like permease